MALTPIEKAAELHDREILRCGADHAVGGILWSGLRTPFVAASFTTCRCFRAAVSVEGVQPWTR